MVLLDEAHFNSHTIEGRYAAFVKLLRRDGFVVAPLRSQVTPASLGTAKILVIANALGERNTTQGWNRPTPPAFNRDEVETIRRWVRAGGSLLLIADHMPFPGAAETLAGGFGVLFTNGFASDSTCGADEFVFRRSDGSLGGHPIVTGRNRGERIDSVRTFTGQAFRLHGPGRPILTLPKGATMLRPRHRVAIQRQHTPDSGGGHAPGSRVPLWAGPSGDIRRSGDVLGTGVGTPAPPDGDERSGRGTESPVPAECDALAGRIAAPGMIGRARHLPRAGGPGG